MATQGSRALHFLLGRRWIGFDTSPFRLIGDKSGHLSHIVAVPGGYFYSTLV